MNLSPLVELVNGKKVYIGAVLYMAWLVGGVFFDNKSWEGVMPQVFAAWTVMFGRAALKKLPFSR